MEMFLILVSLILVDIMCWCYVNAINGENSSGTVVILADKNATVVLSNCTLYNCLS